MTNLDPTPFAYTYPNGLTIRQQHCPTYSRVGWKFNPGPDFEQSIDRYDEQTRTYTSIPAIDPCGDTYGVALGAGHTCTCGRTQPHTADGTMTEAHGCPCGNWWPQTQNGGTTR